MLDYMMTKFAEQTSFMVVSFDILSNRLIFINSSARQRFNLQEGGGFDDFIDNMIIEDRNLLQLKLQLIKEKPIEGLILRFQRNDIISHLKFNFYHFNSEDSSQILSIFEDVTDDVEFEENILKHNAKKNAILNILSHDVAGALNTASKLVELAYQSLEKQDFQKINSALFAIDNICKGNISIINSFLKKEFLTSMSVPLNMVRQDVVQSVKNLMDQYKLMGHQLEVEVIFNCKKNQIYIEIDQDKLIQILNNLISNALKFTPKGGAIKISIEESVDFVQICVEDTGIGIPETLKDHIFSKFGEANRTGLNGEQSHGVGLWIIKFLVEWMGGNITFSSFENFGTSFYLTFPKKIY